MIVFLTQGGGGILNPSLLSTKTVPRRVLSLGVLVSATRRALAGAVFWRAVSRTPPRALYSVALLGLSPPLFPPPPPGWGR